MVFIYIYFFFSLKEKNKNSVSTIKRIVSSSYLQDEIIGVEMALQLLVIDLRRQFCDSLSADEVWMSPDGPVWQSVRLI